MKWTCTTRTGTAMCCCAMGIASTSAPPASPGSVQLGMQQRSAALRICIVEVNAQGSGRNVQPDKMSWTLCVMRLGLGLGLAAARHGCVSDKSSF